MTITLNKLGIPEISLKHLKAALLVLQHKNVTKAAKALYRSQSAVTLAITDLEKQLDAELFNRTPMGLTPTREGELLLKRVEDASGEFKKAAKKYEALLGGQPLSASLPVFTMDVGHKRLIALVALYQEQNVSAAAAILNITSAAIYSSISYLEDMVQIPLFEHHPSGLSPTPYCSNLTRHCKLAFMHIRHGLDEIASQQGEVSGKITIGTLPYTRTVLVPKTINKVLERYPGISISTQEGNYQQLELGLRNGDLDCIVGAIRKDPTSKGLHTECLFKDNLAVVARVTHPLAQKKRLKPSDLVHLRWILPVSRTPARTLFDKYLADHKLKSPEDFVVSSSTSTIRGLLLESDRVALLSKHQIHYEEQLGLLTVLPINLKSTTRAIGITTRAHSKPSPGALIFISALREIAKRLNS